MEIPRLKPVKKCRTILQPFFKPYSKQIYSLRRKWGYLNYSHTYTHKIDADKFENLLLSNSLPSLNSYMYLYEQYIAILDKYWDLVISRYNIHSNAFVANRFWECIYANNTAIPLIKKHWNWLVENNCMQWDVLCRNEGIFVDEYEFIVRQYFREYIAAELMAKLFHPRNIHKFDSYQLYDN